MGDLKQTMQRVDILQAKGTSSSPGSSTDTPAAKTVHGKDVRLAVRDMYSCIHDKVRVQAVHKHGYTHISPFLQRETKRVYNILVAEDEGFNGCLIAPG